MKILVVDDDLALADVVSFTLRRAGFTIVNAYDGQTALERWEREQPALVVLDLKLPILDGMAVCRRIRAQSSTPILILSVQNEDDDIVDAFELGADDYLTKPFSPRQLLARVKALLRRAGMTQTPGVLTVADLTLDLSRRELQRASGEQIQLTGLEAKLMEALMLNSSHVLPAPALITQIWGANGGDKTMLKQLVHRLRQKIEQNDNVSVFIETIPGVGYALINRGSEE